MIDIKKTVSQKRREREHKKVLELYETIKKENPDFGPYSVYAAIARITKRSTNGVKFIIEKHFTPRTL